MDFMVTNTGNQVETKSEPLSPVAVHALENTKTFEKPDDVFDPDPNRGKKPVMSFRLRGMPCPPRLPFGKNRIRVQSVNARITAIAIQNR